MLVADSARALDERAGVLPVADGVLAARPLGVQELPGRAVGVALDPAVAAYGGHPASPIEIELTRTGCLVDDRGEHAVRPIRVRPALHEVFPLLDLRGEGLRAQPVVIVPGLGEGRGSEPAAG